MDVARRSLSRARRQTRPAQVHGRHPHRTHPPAAVLGAVLALALVLAGLSPAGLTRAAAADGVPPAPAPAVLVPVDLGGDAPVPTTDGLRAATRSALADPALNAPGVVVLDPGTGQTLLAERAGKARIPASTTKLLTAAAALTTLGPTTRIATRVVRDGDTLTIIGGGDATLVTSKGGNPLAGGSASLARLAELTAATVATDSGRPVRVRFDDSLFTGPRLGPGWKTDFPATGVASPVTALMVDAGRATPTATRRVDDPARRAAQVFVAELRKAGVDVRGGVKRVTAPSSAAEVARVESAPVRDLVERMLTDSDNDLAESVAHLIGVAAGKGGSFAGGAAAVTEAVGDLGVNTSSLRLADGSGLSRRNAVTPTALARVLQVATDGSTPALGAIVSGLPVAGVTGTLDDRYERGAAQRDAAGYVRAKTGTLTGVIALAGTVEDVSGRVLVFALISNGIGSIEAARDAADDFAAALAGCGC